MTLDGDDAGPKRRRDPFVVQDWMKFSVAVIAGVVGALAWMEGRFVSRVEWTAHQETQRTTIADMASTQKEYAVAERGTASSLSGMNAKLAVIEARQQMVLDRLNGRVK